LIRVVVSLLLPILAFGVGQQDSQLIEQNHFCVECSIEHPVPLPPAALKTLQGTNDKNGEHNELERCAKEDGISVRDIPEPWFVASETTLKKGEAPGLVVQANNACLWGAHIGPFWLLAGSNAGYRLLFAGRADGFDVLEHVTNGYPDIELVFLLQAGSFIGHSKFCYKDGNYQLCGKRTEQNPL